MEIIVNYWAVLAAAVASMVVGMLWYGPLFGKHWMKLGDISMAQVKKSGKKAMLLGFVTAFFMAMVLAWLSEVLLVFLPADILSLTFWLWLGFFVPLTAGAWLWEGKPFKLFVLNAAHWFVAVYVMLWVIARFV